MFGRPIFICPVVLMIMIGPVVKCQLLCRACGATVVDKAEHLDDVEGFARTDFYNMSILGRTTLVQEFRNPANEEFRVITADESRARASGSMFRDFTWFADTRWTTTTCRVCDAHLGWFYAKRGKTFHGLVLDYLISAEYADSLLLNGRPILHNDDL